MRTLRSVLRHFGTRIVEERVAEVLNHAQLEALYGSPIEQLADPDTGGAAFCSGDDYLAGNTSE